MDTLKAMRVYEAVVESGSLVGAANRLGTSTTAVSRQLVSLEEHLGTRLLNRTTRRISLTDSGQEFFNRVQPILADIDEAEAIAGERSTRPSGVLRVSAPLSFGISTLSHWLVPFINDYPDLKLDVDLNDRVIDLAAEGMDVAVRIGRSPGSDNLIVKQLAPVRMLVCASPSYLQRRGYPKRPQDLSDHDTLNYTYLSSGEAWTLVDGGGRESTVRIRPRVQATNGEMLRDLALAGAGIILQPSFIVEGDIAARRLVPLLEDWNMKDFNLYAVYLSRKFLSAKVRIFIDHLVRMAGRHAV
jgi:DNA-binding transcriptional LysR family regulator